MGRGRFSSLAKIGGEMKSAILFFFVAASAFTSCSANADEPCAILARNLKQDVLEQGTSSAQFAQLQNLVSDHYYEDWNNASSSSSSFTGTLRIPDLVDFAIGDGQKSMITNWGARRTAFLSITIQQTSSVFGSSNRISQASVAAIQAISHCAAILAQAEGVFAELVNVSPNRDAFAVRIWRRTGGTPDWKLKSFSVQPSYGSGFSCSNGWEQASESNPLPLPEQAEIISCQKNPSKHLIFTAQTTAGPGGSFELEFVYEEIKQLRERIDLVEANSVPKGTVAWFNKPSCPTGWNDYSAARGRTIFGAGNMYNTDITNQKITNWSLGQTGGEEKHQLKVSEMPSYSHTQERWGTFTGSQGSGGTWSGRGSQVTGFAGGDEPHNTIPPFVALTPCEKQ